MSVLWMQGDADAVVVVPPVGKPGTAAYRRGVNVVLVNDPTLPAGIVTPRIEH